MIDYDEPPLVDGGLKPQVHKNSTVTVSIQVITKSACVCVKRLLVLSIFVSNQAIPAIGIAV